MGREFELKYRATPGQQAAIRAAFGDFAVTDMETTYYDTPDGAMAARKITLRRRLENRKSVCTVKTPAQGGGRGEWETECDHIESAILVLCKLGCPEDLTALAQNGLVAVCGARFTRLHREITVGTDTLELALDAGSLLGGGKEVPLCEVELELKQGCEDTAAAYAAALAAKYSLTPEEKSKFRRALDLAKGV
jgi:inorganic triphosphatase YgiF